MVEASFTYSRRHGNYEEIPPCFRVATHNFRGREKDERVWKNAPVLSTSSHTVLHNLTVLSSASNSIGYLKGVWFQLHPLSIDSDHTRNRLLLSIRH